MIVMTVREYAPVENVTANQAGSCMTALVIFSATFIYIILDSSKEKTFLGSHFSTSVFSEKYPTQFYPFEQRPA